MLAGVIFDFDGVIVDTEPLHYQAFEEALEGENLSHTWEDYLQTYIGYDDRDALRIMFERAGRELSDYKLKDLIAAKALAFRELVDRKGIDPYPGVLGLIDALNGHVPLALCTGSLLDDIVPILEKLDLTLAFDVAVTAEDVHASKPDPASYQLAVERLAKTFPDRGVTAGCCLAIEDTPYGILSAQGAGLKALAVGNTHAREKLEGASAYVETLEGLDLDMLNRFVEA